MDLLIILALFYFLVAQPFIKMISQDLTQGQKLYGSDMKTLAQMVLDRSRANGFPKLLDLDQLMADYIRNNRAHYILTLNTNINGHPLDIVPEYYEWPDIISYYQEQDYATVFLYDENGQIYWSDYTTES